MYDTITSEVIKGTASLDGVDTDNLPEELTKVYAEIVAARLKFREMANDRTDIIEGKEAFISLDK
ncbi:Uncharacterised protein [Yersinia frederiksenii]|uniref:Uncharacterized protein n=1 Tax=Yersinia frederiksenii TaxID=29484 RepID=A0A380SBK9_YERFR|nr:hypothetical protein [Yersinia frederiksenii]SUQ39544.1 Uncharacterised protein [Yersinia frederiksenii]